MTLKQKIEKSKANEKIKVEAYFKDPMDKNLDIFLAVGNQGAQFKQGQPVDLPVELIKFMIDPEMCGIPEYYIEKENGRQIRKHKMVSKYIVKLADEDEDESIGEIKTKQGSLLDDSGDFKSY